MGSPGADWAADLGSVEQVWRRKPILVGPPGDALAAAAMQGAAWTEWRIPASRFRVPVLSEGRPTPRVVRVRLSSHWPSVRASLDGPEERDLDPHTLEGALAFCRERNWDVWFEVPLRVENAFYLPATAAWIERLGGRRLRVGLPPIDAGSAYSDPVRHFKGAWLEELVQRTRKEAPGLAASFPFHAGGAEQPGRAPSPRRWPGPASNGGDRGSAATVDEREPPAALVLGHCRVAGELHLGEDGGFYPCDRLRGPEHRVGQASEQAVPDVWNGAALREHRRRFLSGDPPAACRACPCRTPMPQPVKPVDGDEAGDQPRVDLLAPSHLGSFAAPPSFRWRSDGRERTQRLILMPRGGTGPVLRFSIPRRARSWSLPAEVWDSLEAGLLHWWTIEQRFGLFRRGRVAIGEVRAFLKRREDS